MGGPDARILAAFAALKLKPEFATGPDLVTVEPRPAQVAEVARRLREVWTDAELDAMDDRAFGHGVRTVWELVRWTYPPGEAPA